MSTVSIPIGKSVYSIDCDEESKGEIQALGVELNKIVNKMALEIRGVDDKTLLVIASLTILDELRVLKGTQSEKNESEGGEVSAVIANSSDVNEAAILEEKFDDKGERYTHAQVEEAILSVISSLMSKVEAARQEVRKKSL